MGPENKSDTNNFLTPNQAARFLNISLSTLKKFIYLGSVKTLKTPGGHHRIRRNNLLKAMGKGSATRQSNFILPSLGSEAPSKISQRLVNLLEKRRKFCRGHANAVAQLGLKIAKILKFSAQKRARLNLACLLHDVGMLAIDEDILNKAAKLSLEEEDVIKTHPALGEEIVRSNRQFNGLARIIRQHHERYDGTGYPDMLNKGKICIEAKIISLAEAFVSMTASDSYKETLSEKEATEEIEKNAARQFDPWVVEAFLRI